MHFKNTSQGNFANGQCLLIENVITLYMELIARAELMSPFIYPFILGCCSSVWKNNRNQCSDFGNYHNIYCASRERDWFMWSAGSLKEWLTQFPFPWCQLRIKAADKGSSATSVPCAHSSGRLKVQFASGHPRAGSRRCTRTPVSTNSVKFLFLPYFSEKWWPRSSYEDFLCPVNIPVYVF